MSDANLPEEHRLPANPTLDQLAEAVHDEIQFGGEGHHNRLADLACALACKVLELPDLVVKPAIVCTCGAGAGGAHTVVCDLITGTITKTRP